MPEIAAGKDYPLCPEGPDILRLKEVEVKAMPNYGGTGTTDRLIWKFVSRRRDAETGEFFEIAIFTPTYYTGHAKSKLTWILRMIDKQVNKDWIKANKLNTDNYVNRDYETMIQHQLSEDGSKTYAMPVYLKPVGDTISLDEAKEKIRSLPAADPADPFTTEGEVIPCETCRTEITELERQRCLTKWNGDHYFCTPHAKAFLAQEADLFAAA